MNGEWIGLDGSLRRVQDLRQAWQRNALRRGIRAAGRILADAERAGIARHRLGLLAESIGLKVTGRGLHAAAIVGARRGYGQSFAGPTGLAALSMATKRQRKLSRGMRIEGENYTDPVRYAHLVEHGRREVRPTKTRVLYSSALNRFFGQKAAAVEAAPFMGPALPRSRAAMETAFTRELKIEVARRGV